MSAPIREDSIQWLVATGILDEIVEDKIAPAVAEAVASRMVDLAALRAEHAALVRALRRVLISNGEFSHEMAAHGRAFIESDVVPAPDPRAKADTLAAFDALSLPLAKEVPDA